MSYCNRCGYLEGSEMHKSLCGPEPREPYVRTLKYGEIPLKEAIEKGFNMKDHDPVNHPSHYTGHPSGVECIRITEHFNFNLGNAIKYIWRAGEKGNLVQDLEKARWYIDRELIKIKESTPLTPTGEAKLQGAFNSFPADLIKKNEECRRTLDENICAQQEANTNPFAFKKDVRRVDENTVEGRTQNLEEEAKYLEDEVGEQAAKLRSIIARQIEVKKLLRERAQGQTLLGL